MNVILKESVIHLGRAGEVVKTKSGYARNYLIPKGLAMIATKANMEILESQRAEMDWLERSEQKVIKSSQQALTDLEALANREAQRRGLTVKRVKHLPALEAPSLEFHRARVEIEVSGREQVLFQWIDRLNTPSDLRAATTLSINPKKDDDTQVDCRVTLEQWFLPKERWESENTSDEG